MTVLIGIAFMIIKETQHCVTLLGPGLRTSVNVFEVNYQEEE